MGDAAVGTHPEQGILLRSWPAQATRFRVGLVGRVAVATTFGVAVLLAGCGGSGNDTPPPASDDTGNSPESGSADEQDREPDDEDSSPSEEPGAEADTPTDVREIDWAATTWRTSCDTGTTFSVALERAAEEEPGTGRHVAEIPTDGVDSYHYSVDVDEVVYADVTGDGQEEAAFLSSCFPGNYAVESVEVWRITDGGPEQLPPVVTHDPGSGTIDDVEPADDSVRITTSEPDPSDGEPVVRGQYPVDVVTDWRFSDERWEATEVSRETSDRESAEEPDLTTAGFVLPSGNIVCERSVNPYFDGLACVILSGTQPSLDASCDERDEMWLPRSEPARPGCERSDPVNTDQPTLPYGARWASEGIGCVASETGLECANESGHGFWLSRHGWRTW